MHSTFTCPTVLLRATTMPSKPSNASPSASETSAPSGLGFSSLRGCAKNRALSHHGVKEKYQPLYQKPVLNMAEKPGFEPGRHSTHPTPLAGEPLRPLGYFSICIWRRERDSNPRCLSTSLVFKTSAINHSAISPCKPANMIISDAEEVVNIYTLFFCRNWQSFLRMALSEGKAPLPHR